MGVFVEVSATQVSRPSIKFPSVQSFYKVCGVSHRRGQGQTRGSTRSLTTGEYWETLGSPIQPFYDVILLHHRVQWRVNGASEENRERGLMIKVRKPIASQEHPVPSQNCLILWLSCNPKDQAGDSGAFRERECSGGRPLVVVAVEKIPRVTHVARVLRSHHHK